MNCIRIGTRDSKLAMWQANWVKTTLSKFYPDKEFLLIPIKTKGDKILDVALSKIGDKGLFTKELEQSLLNGEIDLAVHSLKDLPTTLPAGLDIAAYCKREEPRDVLISKAGHDLTRLPQGAVIGTSSLRRIAQLKHYRSDLIFKEIRGNLQTRWQKLQHSDLDAIVLAAAGVIRLGWQDRITQFLPEEIVLPAVGQGSIAVEIASDRPDMRKLLSPLNHAETEIAVKAERSMMRHLEGGCQVPIAGYARVEGNAILLKGMVASLDGSQILKYQAEGNDPEELGKFVANQLQRLGADKILADVYVNNKS
mgnify:CR=1 FL=1